MRRHFFVTMEIQPLRIHLIDAGGTITSVPDNNGILSGAATCDDLPRALLDDLPSLSIEKVYSGLSEAMTFADFASVSQAIRRACSDPEIAGVVVAHGTDTMEESAYYSDLLHDCAKPVIFTGAQRAPHAPDFDGHRNLSDAVTLAGMPKCSRHGVLVVFGGEIIPAAQACKFHLSQIQGFCARDGNSGSIQGTRVKLPEPKKRPSPFERGPLQEDVALISLAAGMSGRLVDATVAAGYSGIVICGLGSGNAPAAVCEAIMRAMAGGVVIAIGTRCLSGDVDGLYASGRSLIESGAIALHSLPAPQARILLSIALQIKHGSIEELIRELS
jgi:L-asparaginase